MQDLPPETLGLVLQEVPVRNWGSLACTCTTLRSLLLDDAPWKALALRMWGPCVETLAAPRLAPGAWRAFCLHRLPNHSPCPASPLGLLQEAFPDPWAHLACCLLCSRTTGGPVVRAAAHAFLECWPSPSAVLLASEPDLLVALRPLGLQAQRLAALRAMSRDFLQRDWEDPAEFKGCGSFVSDSWKIFCRGLRDARKVCDANLSRYLQWLNSGQGDGERKRRRVDSAPRKKAAPGEAMKKAERGSQAGGQSAAGPGAGARRQTRSMAARNR